MKQGVEVYASEVGNKCLKLLKSLKSHLPSSLVCWHTRGGTKALLTELHKQAQCGYYVFKTDVYSYYASIDHTKLLDQLDARLKPILPAFKVNNLTLSIYHYLKRTIMGAGGSHSPDIGLPKGGCLSPYLGAVYLHRLDTLMQKWMQRGDVYYARFMDDLILVAKKRSVFRRAKQSMLNELALLNLSLRYEKTYIGRFKNSGFDFLGYNLSPANNNFIKLKPQKNAMADGRDIAIALDNTDLGNTQPSNSSNADQARNISLTINEISISKALDKAKRCYAQGGEYALASYLKRWKSWAKSGLTHISDFEFYHKIDAAVKYVEQKVKASVLPYSLAKDPPKPRTERWCTGVVDETLENQGSDLLKAAQRADLKEQRRLKRQLLKDGNKSSKASKMALKPQVKPDRAELVSKSRSPCVGKAKVSAPSTKGQLTWPFKDLAKQTAKSVFYYRKYANSPANSRDSKPGHGPKAPCFNNTRSTNLTKPKEIFYEKSSTGCPTSR